MVPQDFSQYRHFPGTDTSRFGLLVQTEAAIAKLNVPLFAGLLFILALIPTLGDLPKAVALWLFFIVDWILVALLPRADKSYGPSKPPTLFLALLRLVPATFPFPWFIPAQLLGTLLVVYGFWIEPHQIKMTYEKLAVPGWKAKRPLRLLHFGDMHIERITERERQLVDLAKSANPDVILFSGDLLGLSNVRDSAAWEHAREILGALHAPLGVYLVTGSPPVDPQDVIAKVLRGKGNIRWLRNEKVTLEFEGQPMDIVGVTCTHRPFIDAPRLDAVLKGKPENFTILLYHTPDLAPEAALRGINLQLSGHTHGGQVRLPFFGALYAASLYGRKLQMGRYRLGGMTLYVSRGLGLEGEGAPRVRFLCPPEVTLWEIS